MFCELCGAPTVYHQKHGLLKRYEDILNRSSRGNKDIDSKVCISLSKWKKILEGMEFEKGAYSWYEGKRTHVIWEFNRRLMGACKGCFSISSIDEDYVDGDSLEEIDVTQYE